LRDGFFLLDDQILNVTAAFKKCKNNRVITFVLFNFCNNCLFDEVSNNENLIFLQVIRVFWFLLMGFPWQSRKYIRVSTLTKRLKSTVLATRLYSTKAVTLVCLTPLLKKWQVPSAANQQIAKYWTLGLKLYFHFIQQRTPSSLAAHVELRHSSVWIGANQTFSFKGAVKNQLFYWRTIVSLNQSKVEVFVMSNKNFVGSWRVKLNVVQCYTPGALLAPFKYSHGQGRRQRGASGARPPHLKSVPPHFTFGPPVAAYIQYCILKIWSPSVFWPLLLVFGPPCC